MTVSGDDITMGTNTSGNLLVADGTNFNSIAVGDLSEISTVANDDVFLAVDTSGGGLKKITRSAIVSGLAVSGATLSNVVEDTTPQLGGNLDVNGNDIVSVSNGNINILPNGSGKVIMDGDGSSGGVSVSDGTIDIRTGTGSVAKILFYCESSNAHAQTLQAQPHSAGVTNVLTLPGGGDQEIVGTTDTQTLTNKTLTSPVISTVTGSTITLDSAGDITLDADGADVVLKDGGTTFGSMTNSSGELVIKSGSTPTTAMTFSGANVTLAGNLTVSGTTTTVNTTNTTISDNLLELNSGASSNSNDVDIIIQRGSTGNDALFMWDESADKFALGTTTDNASSTGNLNMTTGTLVANIEGDVTGNVTGNVTGTAATVTGAAQSNITSLGTLTTLTVDNIIINGTTIGHTSDTDAITIASNGNVTVSQNLTVTGDLTVSGDDITMGTNTSGHIMVADGTNFNPVAVSGDISWHLMVQLQSRNSL